MLGKIVSRYGKFMDEFISGKPGVISSVSKQLSIVEKKGSRLYKKLNPKCTFYEDPESDPENERYKI